MIKTFLGNLERKDARVQVGDVMRALGEFPDATKIYLSFKTLKRLDGALLDGIEVEERGGVLAWELWLEVPDNPVKPHQTHQNRRQRVTKIKNRKRVGGNFVTSENFNNKKRGRPRKKIGEKVSRMTEYRRQKEQQGVLL